ncbi:MAG: phage tail protein [Lachnospiraceae bacterium]|nr:phage tail protein [Lachnospiraceae bacterium]
MARYTIKKNRIKNGCVTGFSYTDDAKIAFYPEAMYHSIFLKGIDGGDTGAKWGRLSFDVKSSENVVYYIYVLAVDRKEIYNEDSVIELDAFFSDKTIETPEKIAMMKSFDPRRFVETNDCLLYDLNGRYLYVGIEAIGEGELELSNIVVDSVGDVFMDTYPEVYRERNSFFHRYVSIYSSIYTDFERDIAKLPKLLDLNTCPEELLIVYGGWMGLDLRGGFLEKEVLRNLVREAYSLNRMKGTKWALERILKIILGEDALIIEHNHVRGWIKRDDVWMPENFRTKGVYDVTILVKKHLTEELRHQLAFMIDQFKPVRTRINITQMDEMPTTDSNTYLDVNTKLPEEVGAVLDGDGNLNSNMILG